jgi:stage V sporulation protein D (sporulation-specific penicillin-binding protein)
MVTDVLANVVRRGTGQRAELTSYEVAGKTGTAQKLVDGHYSHNQFVSSFACLAPVEKPRISVLVVVDGPTSGASYYGGTVAAPSAARVVEGTLFYLQVPPQPPRMAQGTQRASAQEMGW